MTDPDMEKARDILAAFDEGWEPESLVNDIAAAIKAEREACAASIEGVFGGPSVLADRIRARGEVDQG